MWLHSMQANNVDWATCAINVHISSNVDRKYTLLIWCTKHTHWQCSVHSHSQYFSALQVVTLPLSSLEKYSVKHCLNTLNLQNSRICTTDSTLLLHTYCKFVLLNLCIFPSLMLTWKYWKTGTSSQRGYMACRLNNVDWATYTPTWVTYKGPLLPKVTGCITYYNHKFTD